MQDLVFKFRFTHLGFNKGLGDISLAIYIAKDMFHIDRKHVHHNIDYFTGYQLPTVDNFLIK